MGTKPFKVTRRWVAATLSDAIAHLKDLEIARIDKEEGGAVRPLGYIDPERILRNRIRQLVRDAYRMGGDLLAAFRDVLESGLEMEKP
jgi:hypothetical protein